MNDGSTVLIPAQPGFYPIYEDGRTFDIGRDPIIAWKITDASIVEAVSVWGTASNLVGFVTPEGYVVLPEGTYESWGDFVSRKPSSQAEHIFED